MSSSPRLIESPQNTSLWNGWRLPTAAFVVGALLVMVPLTGGCDQKAASPSISEVEDTTPIAERQFERIVTDIKRDLALAKRPTPVGAGLNFRWTQEVGSQLNQPEGDDGAYTGVITITTKSVITKYLSSGDDDEEGASADEVEADAEAAAPEGGVAGLAEASPIQRVPNKDVKEYQLKHADGEWQLVNPPDPETEGLLATIFDRVLSRQ